MTIKRASSIPKLRQYTIGPIVGKTAKQATAKKSVRFSKSKKGDLSIQVKFIPSIKIEDKKDLYLTYTEKENMRENAVVAARNTCAHDNRITMTKRPNGLSYTSLITRAFQSCEKSKFDKLSEEEHELLIQYLAESHAHCRGLEKLTIQPSIKEKQLRLRRNAIRSLIDNYSMEMANKGYLSSKAEASLVENYRRSSSSSRRFARLLAQVDEEAIALEKQIDEEENNALDSHSEENSVYSSFRISSPRTVVE